LATTKFTVEALYINGTEENIGNAVYDKTTDRLVFVAKHLICMPALALLSFYKIAAEVEF
jgi:hypothetical protein